MYPFRLIACASKLTELSPEMFTQCHAITDIQVSFMHNIIMHTFKVNIEMLLGDWSEKSTPLNENLRHFNSNALLGGNFFKNIIVSSILARHRHDSKVIFLSIR